MILRSSQPSATAIRDPILMHYEVVMPQFNFRIPQLALTLLAAACVLSGCDGAQKTQPAQSASPTPTTTPAPLSPLEQQAVGQWVINITEYAKFLRNEENARDKTKQNGYPPIMGIFYAPLMTTSIAPDHSIVMNQWEASVFGTWSVAGRNLIMKREPGMDDSDPLHPFAQVRDDGVFYAGTDWKIPLERIVPTPTKPIAESAVGKWTLDTHASDAYLNRYIEAVASFDDGQHEKFYTEFRSALKSQRLPDPFTIEITLNRVTMKVGDRSRSWPYQIRAGFLFMELDPNEPIYNRDGTQGTRTPSSMNPQTFPHVPIIVVGENQLRIICDQFNMFPELTSLPAYKQSLLTSAFFKRDTAESKK